MAIAEDHIFFCFQNLFLSSNFIEFIHRFAFIGLNTLFKLDISNNRLTSTPPLDDVESTLRELYLSRNYIKHIKDSYFVTCRKIGIIDISFNQLTQFPSMQNIAKTIAVFQDWRQ